ncbi:hypothetical protein Hanom_Chr09g00860821 [Helianthus anomalus]
MNDNNKKILSRTCIKEPYKRLDLCRVASVTPRAATFFCKEHSHRGLLICIQRNGERVILTLCKPRSCMALDVC